jgi:hypothetical protein
MARKASDRIITETPPESAVPPLAENNGTEPATPSSGQEKPATKKEAVILAMAAGMEMPKGIAQYAQDHFGMEITTQYVSVLKGELKKEAGAGQKKKRKPGRKPRTVTLPVEQPAPSTPRARPASPGPGLTPQDLASLADIAQRAGGLDQLQVFLAALKRIR